MGCEYVGKNIAAPDAADKARGVFSYLAEMLPARALHARIVFSDRPHALVRAIRADDALSLGDVRILTFRDVPDAKYNSGEWFPGQNDHPDETMLTGHVRHVGDRIALIAAADPETVERALGLIEIEYEDLPPLVDPAAAARDAHLLHDDGVDLFRGSIAYGDVDAAFAHAAHVVRDVVSTPKIHHAAMEPHAVLALPLEAGGVEIRTPCQIAYGVQHAVAMATGFALSKIRIVKTPMGGSFGGKQETLFEPLCAWAAHRWQRPVFIETNRAETMTATRTRAAVVGAIETAVGADGLILGRRIDATVDAGAYLSGTKKVAMAMGKKVPRLYRIPALRYDAHVVRTTTTPAGACRGYGSPQIHAIAEIHTDLLCRRLGFDPVEFRLKNLVHPFDRDLSGAADLGDMAVVECLRRGLDAFDWAARATPSAFGRYRRGAGFACCTHGNGYYKTIYHDTAAMSLRILEDGTAILRAGVHDLGHGLSLACAQIAGEVLGISPTHITVLEADSWSGHYDIGCQASRGIFVQGECARLAAERAAAMLCEEAEKLWNAPAALSGGRLAVGDRSMTLGEAVRQIEERARVSIDVTVTHRPEANPASAGAHFAQVLVDTATGLVRVEKYLAVHNVGRAINPRSVEGQIFGGVQMGIGMALYEDLAFNAAGHPSATNFDKYHLINAPDMPDVEVLLVGDDEAGGPFGAKSVGEIAAVPPAPAVVNAVNRALGTELTKLPLKPADIVAALLKK